MRRLACMLTLFILALSSASAIAQTGSLTATPSTLTVTGSLNNGPLAATLRLTSSESLYGVHLLVSDLTDATGDGRVRDPLPASAVTLLPSAQFAELPAGSVTQIVVQVMPPSFAGTYASTLIVRWEKPTPGELAVPITVVARTKPVLALQNPAQVLISGTSGERISRQVTLRETAGGSPLTGLRALPQDLTTAGGERALSAAYLSVDLPVNQIQGSGLLTATLDVDLRNAPPGAYNGQVLFSDDSGELLALPITVNVRYGPFWPGFVLVIGVGLGLYLSNYQERGKPRDELTSRVVTIRKTMEDDVDFREGFGPRLSPVLEKVEYAIRAEQWDEAKTAIQGAEELVRKWRGGAQAWTKQINYLRVTILPRLSDDVLARHGNALALCKLRQQVDDALDGAADFVNPSALHDKTLEIETKLIDFEAMSRRLDEIGQARTGAPSSLAKEAETWRLRQAELGSQLAKLLPGDAGWDQLDKDIQSLGEQVLQAIQNAQPPATLELLGGGNRGGPARVAEEVLARLRNALLPSSGAGVRLPEAGPFTLEAGQRATRGLEWFSLITYALGGLVLAAVGYSILYLAKPTFGADWVTDYLALLVWGLGAQATFTDVAGLVRGWGIPFGKK